jgi:hypothetical protein
MADGKLVFGKKAFEREGLHGSVKSGGVASAV